MNTKINEFEKELDINLPESYKNLLTSFEKILLLELANGEEVDFHSVQNLVQPYDKNHKRYQMITVLMEDYLSTKNTSQLYCHDTKSEIESKDFIATIYFGKIGDNSALFFHPKDWSIWEFWQDDCSIGKIADSFDDFIANSEIIEKDNWNTFLQNN